MAAPCTLCAGAAPAQVETVCVACGALLVGCVDCYRKPGGFGIRAYLEIRHGCPGRPRSTLAA